MRIVFDTNIYISFVIGKILLEFKDLVKAHKITILTSTEQMNELINVLGREKLKKYINEENRITIIRLLEKDGIFIDIKKRVTACRDSKDNFILEIALNGKAEYIVTGDQDLLELNPFKDIKIISYRDLKKELLI